MVKFIAIKSEFLREFTATSFGVVVFLLDQHADVGCCENMDIEYALFRDDEIVFKFIFRNLML